MAATDVTLRLVVIRGGEGLKSEYPLTQQVITLGRSLNNLIVLQDSKVSRYHAEIVKQEGEFVIRDLESANGVRVNNSRVMNKALEPGDVLSVGNTEFRVEMAVGIAAQVAAETLDLSALAAAAENDAPAFLTGMDLDREDEKFERLADIEPSAGLIPGRGGGFPAPPMIIPANEGRVTLPAPPVIIPANEGRVTLPGRDPRTTSSGQTQAPFVPRPAVRPPPGLFDRSNRPSFDDLAPERPDATGGQKLLEHAEVPEGSAAIGGLGHLVDWLANRGRLLHGAGKNIRLPRPSAITVVSGPGCGKSLVMRYIAANWRMNFFRLRLPYLLYAPPDKWLEHLSEALGQVVAYNPAFLAVEDVDQLATRVDVMGDEVKRSYYMAMEVLTLWVRTKPSSPFTLVTGTHPRLIHPDLLRRGGSLDEIFFLDIPHIWERLEILEGVLVQYGKMPDRFDLKVLAEGSEGFTGAQLHEGLVAALFVALADNREVTTQDVRIAFSRIVPAVHTFGKHYEEVRQWGRMAARYASYLPAEIQAARGMMSARPRAVPRAMPQAVMPAAVNAGPRAAPGSGPMGTGQAPGAAGRPPPGPAPACAPPGGGTGRAAPGPAAAPVFPAPGTIPPPPGATAPPAGPASGPPAPPGAGGRPKPGA